MNALAHDPRPDMDLQGLRDSTTHVLAQAVTDLFPGARLGSGAVTDAGFCYDFELPRAATPADLPAIEKRMREIISARHPIGVCAVAPEEARRLFAEQPYKLELLDGIERDGDQAHVYRHGDFADLCSGAHLPHTAEIPLDAFRLTHISGAYWRGDERRSMLQRIHGTAWVDREHLEEHLWRQEEAIRRDHRRLAQELDLFSISDEVGPGLILWHPRGTTVRGAIEAFMQRAHVLNGYQHVVTPHIGRSGLWETSGHLDFFRDEMYPAMQAEGEAYYVKPMNCPFHAQIFKSRHRSYRDLPLRLVENGAVYRYERSGVLHGMTRPRGFTQDDAHIFCSPEDVEGEIRAAVDFALSVLRAFGLNEFMGELSTKPEKAVGEDDDWERATAVLRSAAEERGLPWRLDAGGGAFYGPKLSIKLRDALGREWQCGTIQFDFNLPTRFGLEYTGKDGQAHRPFMVHRALMGSIERFVSLLIEHFSGAFPLWLAPVQAVLLPVAARHEPYARSLAGSLVGDGLRVEVVDAEERQGARIRRAQLEKVPYMLIVGDREMESGEVSVRVRDGEDRGRRRVAELLAEMRASLQPELPRRNPGTNGWGEAGSWDSRCCP